MNQNNKLLKNIIIIFSFNFININIINSAAPSDEIDKEPKVAQHEGPLSKYEKGVLAELNKPFPQELGNLILTYNKIDPKKEDSIEEYAAGVLNIDYPLYAPGTHNLLQPLQILGLAPGPKYSPSEIQSARRKKLLLFHPDKNANISTEAYTRISQIINLAFDQLQ